METTSHPCGHPVRSNSGLALTGAEAAARVRAGCQVCRRAASKASRDAYESDPEIAADRARREEETATRLAVWVPAARRRAQAALRSAGCVRQMTSASGSNYYVHAATGTRVRVADHSVPLTEERRSNRAAGGKSCADVEILLAQTTASGIVALTDAEFERQLACALEALR